jgi:hypothetical protein
LAIETTETLEDDPDLGVAVLIVSLLKGLPRPMIGFGGFSFLSLGLRTTNKKQKGNYANRHEHGIRCGIITSLYKSFRRHA